MSIRRRKESFARAPLACLLLLTLSGCAALGGTQGKPAAKTPAQPFASTYKPIANPPTLVRNATLLTGTGTRLDDADLLFENGKISALGQALSAPAGSRVIDAKGKWVTPGLIDVHSHIGVYPSPSVQALHDGNEISAPVTAEVWVEHSVWPQDPQFSTALAGGVTTLQILPGSANLFGGRGVTVKNVPTRTVQAMKFPGAPHSLKMACGENPKRVYGQDRKGAPYSRMGNVAGYRKAWIQAQQYIDDWKEYDDKIAKGETAKAPKRDLQMETLADVLKGEILVHNHCYRADEMAVMMDMAKEFGYKVTAFHHAIESYKIADLLAAHGACSAMWADWWGFKIEAYDSVRENIAMVDKAGACAIVHSDDPIVVQHLNQEAAKVMGAAKRKGLDITPRHAIIWLTANPAKAIGVADKTGTLEAGKMADLVIWSGNPFSVYSQAEKVFVDGALLFDRDDAKLHPQSDFDLGIHGAGERL